MGAVTYRVLCRTHKLVLALPPQPQDECADVWRAVRSEDVTVAG